MFFTGIKVKTKPLDQQKLWSSIFPGEKKQPIYFRIFLKWTNLWFRSILTLNAHQIRFLFSLSLFSNSQYVKHTTCWTLTLCKICQRIKMKSCISREKNNTNFKMPNRNNNSAEKKLREKLPKYQIDEPSWNKFWW